MRNYSRYPMDGLKNCRDLGGLPTADGGITRFGVMIRSELPRELTEHDVEIFRELGVTTSIDLRGERECEAHPSHMKKLDFVEYINLSLFNEEVAMGADIKRPEPPKDPSQMEWGPMYIDMLEESKDWARRVVETIAAAPGAVQFNCTTGKDRTGLVSMMLLSIAGVSDEDIIANYAVSEIHMRSVYLTMAHMLPGGAESEADLDRGFFCTGHQNMRTVLRYLKENYGGALEYIRSVGVSDETIKKVHDKLVEY